MDDIENLLRNQSQSDRTVITPPNTKYDPGIRKSTREHPKALKSAETKATEAPKNNLPSRLHKVADVPFLFPRFLREGFSLSAVLFSVIYCGMPQGTSPTDIDRYHFSSVWL
jgi:hypothetical protein